MWLAWITLARADVVDRILHVVGDRIVTQSDVEMEAEFDAHDIATVEALEDPAYPVEQRLVDYAVIRDLAGDVAVYKPPAADVRARFERFRASWGRPEDYAAFLARWGLDDDRMMGFIYSRLVVERYILRNLGAGVTEATPYATWITDQRARASVRDVAK
jgi:hypothetical protein